MVVRVFRKPGRMSGSLVTSSLAPEAVKRELPASRLHGSFHSTGRRTSSLSRFLQTSSPPSSAHPTPLQSTPQVSYLRLLYLQSITMGAIPEVDPDEPVETKPFKFVTGELSLSQPSNGSNSSRN